MSSLFYKTRKQKGAIGSLEFIAFFSFFLMLLIFAISYQFYLREQINLQRNTYLALSYATRSSSSQINHQMISHIIKTGSLDPSAPISSKRWLNVQPNISIQSLKFAVGDTQDKLDPVSGIKITASLPFHWFFFPFATSKIEATYASPYLS